MISRFEKFTFSISVLHRYIQMIAADEMEKYGLKGTYAFYLTAMARYADGLTAAQLGQICGKDKAAVSRAVAEMVESGLISRESVGGGLYRAKLTLTNKGREAATIVSRRADVAVEEASRGMTEENRKVLYDTLDLIATNLQAITKEGLPQK